MIWAKPAISEIAIAGCIKLNKIQKYYEKNIFYLVPDYYLHSSQGTIFIRKFFYQKRNCFLYKRQKRDSM